MRNVHRLFYASLVLSEASFIFHSIVEAKRFHSPLRSARSINPVRTIAGDKREAILRAATTVFAHNGYFNSKVADIAREAGVADGTVYLYFKSKEDILHSIFDRSVDEALAEAKQKIENISDPREKLRQIALLHLERLGADRDLAVVFQVELRGSTKFMENFPRRFCRVSRVDRSALEEERANIFRPIQTPRSSLRSVQA